jgi:hypothetical protein
MLLLVVLPLGAGERLSIKVSPAVSFAPATLVIKTTVEANANNRAIVVVADGPDFYRSSQIAVDGERGHRSESFEFRNVPGGWYEIRAALVGADGEELAVASELVDVEKGDGAD